MPHWETSCDGNHTRWERCEGLLTLACIDQWQRKVHGCINRVPTKTTTASHFDWTVVLNKQETATKLTYKDRFYSVPAWGVFPWFIVFFTITHKVHKHESSHVMSVIIQIKPYNQFKTYSTLFHAVLYSNTIFFCLTCMIAQGFVHICGKRKRLEVSLPSTALPMKVVTSKHILSSLHHLHLFLLLLYW